MGARVLIADDDAALRETYAESFRLAGFDVAEAADGAEAFSLYQQGRFDLIVTDLLMPRRDGLELLMALSEAGARCPVVVMTGGIGDRFGRLDQSRATCLAAARLLGAVRTLQKPVLPSALINEARKLVGGAHLT